MLTQRQIRPFVWIALLGVVTTALNTIIPLVSGSTDRDLDALRDIVLLVHAPATLLPLIALALVGFRSSPFAAVVVIAFTLLEKFLELAGQALQVFPPEESLGELRLRVVVDAVWDQLFFVLWFCNTLGATAAGLLMFRIAPAPLKFVSLSFAWAAALSTLTMLLAEYALSRIPTPGALLFFLVFTGYRTVLALVLARSATQQIARPLPAT